MPNPTVPAVDPTTLRSAVVQEQLRRSLLRWAATGLGVGAIAGGVAGLTGVRRRARPTKDVRDMSSYSIDLPEHTEKEASPDKPPETFKLMSSDWLNPDKVQALVTGRLASRPEGHPLFLPGVAAATVGGVYGGHRLAKWLLDKRKKRDLQAELDTAKEQYERALEDSFKTASDGPLDRAYAAWQLRSKSAESTAKPPMTQEDWAGYALGLGGFGALGLGAMSAFAVNRMFNAKRRKDLIEKALRRHQQEQSSKYRDPIYATSHE